MVFTKELFTSRFLDLYWYSDGKWLDRDHYIFDHWPCGCFWLCFWKLRINFIYKNHDITKSLTEGESDEGV
jgi:hypothetical protein